jgi:choline dehydrogenase-like flavoprotein
MRPLYFRSEQAPNPLSRVSLGDHKDALGVPQPRLDWRRQDSDTGSILAWLDELDADMRRNSLGHVIAAPEDWEDKIIGGPHHMGTTRMSADPKTGVVNADCRVHSVENLYIAGSSVFRTGGHANPTFTLVAVALRRADELQRTLTRPCRQSPQEWPSFRRRHSSRDHEDVRGRALTSASKVSTWAAETCHRQRRPCSRAAADIFWCSD